MRVPAVLWVVALLFAVGCSDDSTNPAPNPGGDDSPMVTVSPATMTLTAGTEATFTATTENLTSNEVTWTVDGGASNGTVTSVGVYRAPGGVPSPPEVTLRATSVEDPAAAGTARVTVIAPKGPSPELIANLSVALRGSSDATVAVEEGFTAAMIAIFDVSVAAGGTELINTGTFTHNGQTWQHQSEPTDRMVVQASTGLSTTITWTRFFFAEDISSADDLLQAHDVAGRVVVDGLVDISFTSVNGTRCCGSGSFSYSYAGTFTLGGEVWNVTEASEGTSFFDIGSGSFEYRTDERVIADYSSSTQAIHIDYTNDYDSISVDNLVTDTKETIASSYTDNGVTYSYVGKSVGAPAFIRSLTFNGNPSELNLWSAIGGILRNGEVYGILAWEQQLDESFRLVLRSPDGSEILAEF